MLDIVAAAEGKGIMPDLKTELLDLAKPHGQDHLLAFWDRLDDPQRQALAAQIRAIDFALIARLYRDRGAAAPVLGEVHSPPAVRLDPAGRSWSCEAAVQAGREELAAGRVGVILVAGGQGTRLGFDHPKGMYAIGPVSDRTLFQIHVEKILAAGRRYGVRIPLYLMTSPATHEETLDFFARHGRFGLPEEDLTIFCQGTMPATDAATGKVLLQQPDRVFVGPDGHGGMLAALNRSGALAEIQRRGIAHLFYFQVDNPLVDIAGAEFLGYHRLSGSEMTTQVIAKREPLEKVGNVVQVDGRVQIIEYSDLPDELAHRRLSDGNLEIWAGSIGVHAFSVEFLARMATRDDSLPFHYAHKKVPYVDPSGKSIQPPQPNAIKFERFIFDLLPAAAQAIVVEVDPRRAFAPLKNAPGAATDSPEWVRRQMSDLYTVWLEAAGAEVLPDVMVEISPLYALDAVELAAKIPPHTRIAAASCLTPGPVAWGQGEAKKTE
jgi:UDP-N-acetylglucosamine/UDP-N-acetylgalactosamine diphosphorylase